MGEIYIGTSGFSFNDWIGEVYPPWIRKQEMLTHYERAFGFKALEVNFTYYALPSKRTMESFVRRTSPDFVYAVKAYKYLTHERGVDFDTMIKAFKDGVSPLGGSMKALLFQFPYSFVPGNESFDYLKLISDEFAGMGSVVEFRNKKWFDERYMEILSRLSLGYCVVDEPKIKGLLPFFPDVTADVGYFRFHGRNKAWFNSPMEVRYDYLYTGEELEEFVEPVRKVSESAVLTFAFFNNCHAGKAVKNAQTFIKMLKRGSNHIEVT
ncbi:MAG: DUF72 domain-containing protein [Syntrophobacterales bacterium]|jgi:uncharacterized protein YecE (DUF72 family)|nr:DUF72 domain-containing protein [Syntrophobacterales bacterium]